MIPARLSRRNVELRRRGTGFNAVLLDLDGTLIDTEHVCRLAFFSAITELGYSVAGVPYRSLVGRATADKLQLLRRWFSGAFPVDAFVCSYRQKRDEHLRGGVRPKPGALETIALLEKQRIPFAIVTATSRASARYRMQLSGITASTVVTRDDVPATKPDPACMLLAAEKLAASRSRCLVVEDSEPGVHAALLAGMQVVCVPDLYLPHGWDGLTVPSLHHVVRMIQASLPTVTRVSRCAKSPS
jgi:HAD superfamily hydrolase (TIGR01509 family)